MLHVHASVQLGVLPLAVIRKVLYMQLPVPLASDTSTVVNCT